MLMQLPIPILFERPWSKVEGYILVYLGLKENHISASLNLLSAVCLTTQLMANKLPFSMANKLYEIIL